MAAFKQWVPRARALRKLPLALSCHAYYDGRRPVDFVSLPT